MSIPSFKIPVINKNSPWGSNEYIGITTEQWVGPCGQRHERPLNSHNGKSVSGMDGGFLLATQMVSEITRCE